MVVGGEMVEGNQSVAALLCINKWEDDIAKKHAIACHSMPYQMNLNTEEEYLIHSHLPVGRYCYLITSWGSIYLQRMYQIIGIVMSEE